MNSNSSHDPILEPHLPIVDAHHHLWVQPTAMLAAMESDNSIACRQLLPMFRRYNRYLLDEFLQDLNSGHSIRASVFVDALAMYRKNGPKEKRSVGEVEFANGIAAMAASGLFGEVMVCGGIVGSVDLTIGEDVADILSCHVQAGGERYRGVRCPGVVYDPDPTILGRGVGVPHLLLESKFRRGFRHLEKLGLTFEAWVLEPQLPDLIDLAHSFPNTPIILNHVGSPVGVGQYEGKRIERFPIWRESIRGLAACENVSVKLGGLGIPFGGFGSFNSIPPATSVELAREWRPYIETCVEAFGVNRCMFESNFPVDSATCSYPTLWNTFKRITAACSEDEKNQLFSGTAIRVYKLHI